MEQNSLRILYFSTGWPASLCHNGIVSYIEAIREGLEDRGISIKIITEDYRLSAPSDYVIDVSQTKPLGLMKFKIWRYLIYRISPYHFPHILLSKKIVAALKQLQESWTPDILEIEESFGMAETIRKKVKIPVVLRIHGPWFLNGSALGTKRDKQFKKRVRMEGRAISKAKAVTSPSKTILNLVRKEYCLSLKHARVVHNPAPNYEETSSWLPEAIENKSILFVGRFDLHKGGDIALKAFIRLAQNDRELRLIFVGPDRGIETPGTNKKKYFDEFLATLTKDSDILERIENRGLLEQNDILTLRRNSSLTIIPSRFEVFPMTVLEALSIGSPTIACRIGGIPELIDHGKNGLLFEKEDVDGLTERIKELIENKEFSIGLGMNARKRISREFSQKVLSERMEKYYRNVLNS